MEVIYFLALSQLTSANFELIPSNSEITPVDFEVYGNVNLNSFTDWSGFYSQLKIKADTTSLENSEYYGASWTIIVALENSSNFNINENVFIKWTNRDSGK